MVAMVALQVLATQGSEIGWTNPITSGLGAIAVIFGVMFFRAETTARHSVRQLRALSQLDLHRGDDLELPAERCRGDAAGVDDARADWRRPVGAGGRDADARLRHRHRRLHPRRREAAAEIRRAQTDDLGKPDRRAIDRAADADQPADRTVQGAGGRRLHAFRLGLAFYATPSTDAALSNLPDDQAGSGSGIYKMASSLGASFGVAISAAIFTALSADSESTGGWSGVITFAGRQDNVAVRQAALIALAFNLLMVVAAIVSIMLTVPKGPHNAETNAMNALVKEFEGQAGDDQGHGAITCTSIRNCHSKKRRRRNTSPTW